MHSKFQIFVGGSGRSGTSFLARRLGCTKEIARVPYETRFITDNRGLVDLYDSLTRNYSIDKARSSIQEFKDLMLELDKPFCAPYVGYRMSRLSGGKNNYFELLESFLGEVSYGKFHAWDKQNVDRYPHMMTLSRIILRALAFITNTKTPSLNYKKIRSASDLYMPKYFRDKSELAEIISRYIDTLFYFYAEKAGKKGWCENTPSSILHYRELKEVFPKAYFLNVVRNPVAVACSLMERAWAPKDERAVANYLLPLYQRLIDVDMIATDNPHKYKLIKFESLESASEMKILYDFIGLQSMEDKEEKFKTLGAYAWKSRYNAETIKYLEKRLEEPMKYFNYL